MSAVSALLLRATDFVRHAWHGHRAGSPTNAYDDFDVTGTALAVQTSAPYSPEPTVLAPATDTRDATRASLSSAAYTFDAWARAAAANTMTSSPTVAATSSPSVTTTSTLLATATATTSPLVSLVVSSLTGTNGFTMYGDGNSNMAGKYVAGLGDINGDGLADLISSSPVQRTLLGAANGEAYVVFGATDASRLDGTLLDTLNGTNGGFRLAGGIAGGGAGETVTGIGDINGDGLADFAVATPNIGSLSGPSEVAIILGRTSGLSTLNALNLTTLNPASISLPTNDGFRIATASKNLGYDMDGGDFNGDGYSDVALGQVGPNQTYLLFGKSHFGANITGLTTAVATTTAIDLHGGTDDGVGRTVGFAGDVNGDGLNDLLIAAPGKYAGVDGKVYLVFGKTGVPPSGLDGVNLSTGLGTNGVTFKGISGAGGQLGYSTATGIGDINGDGKGDFVMVAPYMDPGGRIDAGSAYVVFGNTAANLATISLAGLNGTNGFRLDGGNTGGVAYETMHAAGVGDVNGDGYDDFAVSEPSIDTADGRVYVIYGHAGSFSALNGANLSTAMNGTTGFTLKGLGPGQASSRFGASVNAAGDVNGDGYDDIVVGAPTQSSDGTYITDGATNTFYGGDFRHEKSAAATTGADILIGTNAANTLDGLGGADSIRGGAGSDVILWHGTERHIDGGGDLRNASPATSLGDTLKLANTNMTLDLSALPNDRIQNIESIDMRSAGTNTLKLNVHDLLDMSGTSQSLFVRGDHATTTDKVDARGSGFALNAAQSSQTVGGIVYDHYTVAGSAAHLLVEHGVTVQVV
ncbi:MAG: FG-GAP repeat protein [Gammaproteobacteria bacterium]|nr:FG-GAP repeat protein [Gammaproteobacteria bacterium]